MFIEKSAQEFYQLFSGIYENKLFLQIVNSDGTLKYSFESKELDTSNKETLSMGIMEACYDFFDPSKFKFEDNFVLGRNEPLLVRRYGEKAVFEESKVIKCTSFDDLQAINTWLFMESFLPFEKPVQDIIVTNIKHLLNISPKWITADILNHGIAE